MRRAPWPSVCISDFSLYLGGSRIRAYGQGDTQGAAETQALNALNKQRAHRYGRSGMTEDAT